MTTENENLASPVQAVASLRGLVDLLANPVRDITNADVALIARLLADLTVATAPGLFRPPTDQSTT